MEQHDLKSQSRNDKKQPLWMRGCVIINNQPHALYRADIPMVHLESKQGAKFYSNFICEMMYSRFEHGSTTTHLSPLHFVMAMMSLDNLHLYYYKPEYFETMQYLWPAYYANNPEWGEYFIAREKDRGAIPLTFDGISIYHGKSHEGMVLEPLDYTFYNHAFEFARQVRWTPKWHNWDGVNQFEPDKTMGYDSYEFYETLDELIKAFGAIGIKPMKMKKVIDNKRRKVIEHEDE